MLQTINLDAGQGVEFAELGDFFRLLHASQALKVRFYLGGREVAIADGVTGGYAEQFREKFDRVRLESATAQSVQFVVRDGNRVDFDQPPNGNVSGAFAHAAHVVTNASGQLLAANVVRRYLLVQNNDAGGDVWVRVDGAAAVVGQGVKIAPGGSWEIAGYVPTGAVMAIGSVASNANVVTVEG